MRMHKMSPNIPAPVTPIASATTTQFSGMASMAPRVEIGFDQLSGVARSSRTGTKRSVKAGPTTRFPENPNGIAPAIQDRRMPFFSNIVVMVPVVTLRRISRAAAMIKPHAAFRPNRSSRRRRNATNGTASNDHPKLAHDLTEEKLHRAECKPEKYD